MNLDEFRQKYPQYAEVADEPLARALHSKFYSTMDFNDFAGRVGYAPKQKQSWLATLRERMTPDPSIEDDFDAGGIGIDPAAAKQTAESMARVGGALGGGLLAFPAGGVAGGARLLGEDIKDAVTALSGGAPNFEDNLGKAAHTVESVAGLPNELLKTEGEQKAIETIMKPMEWVENAGRFYGDEVYNSTGNPNLAATAKTAFEAVSFLGLPEMKAKLIKSARAGKSADMQRATTEAVDILNEIVAGEKAIRKGQKVEVKRAEARQALEALRNEPRRLEQIAEVERRLGMLKEYTPEVKPAKMPAKPAAESAAFFEQPEVQQRMHKQAMDTLAQQVKERAAQGEYGWPRKDVRESAEFFADPQTQAQMSAMEQAGLRGQIQERAGRGEYGWPRKDVRESADFYRDQNTQVEMQTREIEGLKRQIAERDAAGEYAELIRRAEDQDRIDSAVEYGSQPKSLLGGTRSEPATFQEPVRPMRQQTINETGGGVNPRQEVPQEPPTTQAPPVPSRGKLRPTTIGGAIREFTGGKGISRKGVRHHAGSDVFKNLPQEARMEIKNGGTSLDLVEAHLKREGYLYPEQDLIEVLRQEPGAMGYGKIAVEGERATNQRTRPQEDRMASEPEYPPEWDEVRTDADIEALNENSGQAVFDFFEEKARQRSTETGAWVNSPIWDKPAPTEVVGQPPHTTQAPPSPRRGGVNPRPEAPQKSWVEQVKERREANRPAREAESGLTALPEDAARTIAEHEIAQPRKADKPVSQETGVNFMDTLKSEGGSVKIDPRSAKDRHLQSIADDEVLKKVHGMIGDNKKPTTMGDIWVGGMEKMVDRFDALGREKGKAINPIDKMGLPKSEAHKAALRYNSYKDVTALKFNELAKSIPDSVRREPLIFSDYVNAHRAKTRAERGLKNPNKVTLDDANAAVAKWEKKWTDAGRPLKELKTGYAAFQKWADKNILRDLVDAGVLSQERYKAIKDTNEHYAAFDVLDYAPESIDAVPASLPSKEYFSLANQDVIIRMTGTEKRIADPMEATFRKFMRAQELASRNRVASTLIDDPGMAGKFRRVAKSRREFGILRNQKQNPMMDSMVNRKTHEIINRFRDGHVESYAVPKEMAQAMKQLSPASANRVIQAINGAFRKSATTLYIPFTISNAMRDFIMAYTTSPTYKSHQLGSYILDWNKGFWQGVKHEFGGKSNIAKQYVKDGGGFGYSGTLRTEQGAKQSVFSEPSLKKAGGTLIKSVPELIEKASGAVELAPRLAVYERAKRMGISGEDAALLARRSTVDFNQAGTALRVYNQWVPFLNARVQGKLNLARALRRDPKDTLAKVAMTVALPGAATYAWNRLNFSELYDDIPEYIKQNYFVIVTGTGTDEKGRTAPRYHVISKGDTGQMAWNPVEYVLDRMWKKDRESATKFLVNFLSDISPVEFAREGELSASKALSSTMPPPAKAAVEPLANYSFYQGREVVPKYMEGRVRPGKQAFDSTPRTFKAAGEALGVSPLKIQNVMSNLFAGYGREGLDPAAMWRGFTGRLTKVKGGEHERKAWADIDSLETEYQYARSDAAEAVEVGDRNEAMRIMRGWNKEANDRIEEFNRRFSRYGLGDNGGLRRNMFTYDKMRSVLIKREDNRTPIERRLSVR